MIHTHGCWNHSPAHAAGGPLQPIGTHVSKLTNAFQAPQGEENWEGRCVSVLQVQGHCGCIRDPERPYRRCKLGQSNVAAPQMPNHDTHTHTLTPTPRAWIPSTHIHRLSRHMPSDLSLGQNVPNETKFGKNSSVPRKSCSLLHFCRQVTSPTQWVFYIQASRIV